MLNKEQKKKQVTDMTKELKNSKGVVFSSFQGLATKDIQELRGLLKKENVKHKVVKLTLIKKALRQAGIETEKFNVQLPVAVSWSQEDEVLPAKIIHTFAKKNVQLKIVAGILGKKVLEALEVKQLALLPGKQELRGQVVSVIAGPLRGMVNVLAGNLRGIMNVLNAIKDQKSA